MGSGVVRKRFVLGTAGLVIVLSSCGSAGDGAGAESGTADAKPDAATSAEAAFLDQVHENALGSAMPEATALEGGRNMCVMLDEAGVGVTEVMLLRGIPQTHLFHVEAAIEHLCPEHMDKWDEAVAASESTM
jgi:hypothetical protein